MLDKNVHVYLHFVMVFFFFLSLTRTKYLWIFYTHYDNSFLEIGYFPSNVSLYCPDIAVASEFL